MIHPSLLTTIRQPSWFTRVIAVTLAAILAAPPAGYATGAATAVVVVQSSYDGNGNVVTRTDGNGAVTAYTYDAMNRLVSIDYPGGNSPDVSFTYDVNGNRTKMVDATGTTEYQYDQFDRLSGVGYPDGGFVIYFRDYVGNVTLMRYGNTRGISAGGSFTEVAYTYDADNRIATVKDTAANATTSYTYNDAGRPLRRTLPNGVTTDYAYDGDGRLLSVDHKKEDGSRICKYAYTLNAIGNRTQAVETLPDGSTKTTGYTYDALDRLSGAVYPDGRTVTYVYDSFGNRTKMTEVTGGTTKVTDYTYDSDSRLLSTKVNGAADEVFAYDTIGNLIQRTRASDNRQIDYSYDIENRLVHYYDGTRSAQYIYNGIGNRVAKVANGVRTNFVNDPNRKYVQVLSETDLNGNIQRDYEWGNELINQRSGAVRAYSLQDSPDGSLRRLVDSAGGILNSYDYEAFGTLMMKTGSIANAYQFDGESLDDVSGLLFLRSRYVALDLGRFLTRDTLGRKPSDPRSTNPYTFVRSDPINVRDPSGQIWPYLIIEGGIEVLGGESIASMLGMGIAEAGIGPAVAAFEGAAVNLSVRAAGYVAAGSIAAAGVASNPGAQFAGGVILGAVLPDGADSAFHSNIPEHFDSGFKIGNAAKSMFEYGEKTGLFDSAIDSIAGIFASSPKTPQLRNYWEGDFDFDLPGGVALDKSASVLLDINTITGGTYDQATGQIILFGKKDASPTALPKMSLDDLAVAVRAKQLGSFPVVSIEDPVVSHPPEWPSRDCFTVRYGPFHQDPLDGQTKVLDLTSKTHFGWVMFEADRLMKCLGIGKDNRTLAAMGSSVPGYHSWADLLYSYHQTGSVKTRYWFEPKEIVVEASPDGRSMQLTKAEMKLSTETIYASHGQVESTPDAEYFANWFTTNYDAIAEEQITNDDAGQPHKIFKELKQLAYLAGVVKWIDDNHLPVDLTFLKQYQPVFFDSAPAVTPETTFRVIKRDGGGKISIITITGGVTFCHDLTPGTGGSPSGLGSIAAAARPSESSLGWSFVNVSETYNATALSVDRTQKDGGSSPSAVDARLQVNGSVPLILGRYFDSFNITPTLFGYGWKAQPYALEFRGNREVFSLCHQTWSGYGEIWFRDRAAKAAYKFVPVGTYDKAADPQHLASRFDQTKDILVYEYQNKGKPGLLFSDNSTHMTMRLDSGALLDFDFNGLLTGTEDRNGNRLVYTYDSSSRLLSIGQAGGRTITLSYDAQNRVSSAALPGGRTVTYTYDTSGNLTSAQADAPTGWLAKYAYDASHNLTQVQDESGSATATQNFDVYGRVTGTSQPGVATPFAQSYDLASATSAMTGPAGVSSQVQFNESHDPVKTTDARSNSTAYTYNNFRDVTSVTTADTQAVQIYLDAVGHRVATVVPSGRADRAFYDSFGHPTVTFHGPVDALFTSAFDGDHLLISDNNSSYATDFTQYGYDQKGNCTSVTDGNSHTRTFGYNAIGNRISAKDGRGKETAYSYDTTSRLTQVQDPLGAKVNLTYDARDNVTQVATLAGAVNYTYNTKNQALSMTTGDPAARHTYNYTYDAKGSLSTVTDPNGFVTQYSYDARGNLTGVIHDGSTRFTYDYDGLNRVTATHYSGTSGGARASLTPLAPAGAEQFSAGSPIDVRWSTQGDWSSSPNVTIQYSTNGSTWTDLATVAVGSGSYTWANPPAGQSVSIRFTRTGDSTFRVSSTATFAIVAVQKYYVNDGSTAGDQYCSAAGRTYNGTTVTGRTPADPVNDPQAIIGNYALHPGDTVYIDTGNYSLNHDVVITEADSGTPAHPVTIQGPTSGPGAIVTRIASSAPSNAVIDIHDTNSGDSTLLQGITVQNIRVAHGHHGIWLNHANYCVVRFNQCYQNGEAGSAGQVGDGSGIFLTGGGNHTIESNYCYQNGGDGSAGTSSAPNGADGTGFGIFVAASHNVVRFNDCLANGGNGGAAGTASGFTGSSKGVGIAVVLSTARLTDNLITDNTCRDSVMTGRTLGAADSGWAVNYGIFVNGSDNTQILRNKVSGLIATGGDSTNHDGGLSRCVGIEALDNAAVVISGNWISNVRANGGAGSITNSTFQNGEADAVGIWVQSSDGPVISNNLAHDMYATSINKRGQEVAGQPYTGGAFVSTSANCRISNNTFTHNRPFLNPAGNLIDQSGQIFLFSSSTGGVIRNNACVSYDTYCPAISFDSTSVPGTAADFNDLYSQGGNVGIWGATFYSTLAAWRSGSGQDGHSLNVEPRFYNDGAGNFHLAYDSPLIDAATPLVDVLIDGDGESRPARGPTPGAAAAYDIGYDEFVDTDGDTLPDIIETTVTMTSPNDRDGDHDGLPDDWEVAHGLNPSAATGVNGATGDPDGDGYTNLQEYMGHSDPQLASSIPAQPPTITSVTPAGSNLFILEEDTIDFSVTAHGQANAALTYAWKVDGVVQSTAGTFSFVTSNESSGQTALSKVYTVELDVSSGTTQTVRTWSVTVNNRNHAPVLQPIANLQVHPGDTVQFNPVYSDPDNQNTATGDDNTLTVTYSGFMTGPSKTMSQADTGSHLVTVAVQDDGRPSLITQQIVSVDVLSDGTTQGDVINPTLTLSTPAANATVTGSLVTVTGVAKDNLSVEHVNIVLNGKLVATKAPASTAATTFNFSADLLPEQGMNQLQVTAFDSRGNASTPVTRTFTFAHLRPELAGTYNGLVVAQAAASQLGYNGLIKVTVAAAGTFSVKINLSGVTISSTGVFLNDGTARFGPSRTATLPLTKKVGRGVTSLGDLDLKVDLAGGRIVTGKVATAAGTLATIPHADLAGYSTAVKVPLSIYDATKENGKYTALFQIGAAPNNGLAAGDFPGGSGYAAVSVTAAGVVTIVGKSPDNQTLTYSNSLSASNELPMFMGLYSNAGFMVGSAIFDSTQPTSDASGAPLRWFKPAGMAGQSSYRNGWPTGISIAFSASKYLFPKAPVTFTALGIGLPPASTVASANVRVTLIGGGFASPFPTTLGSINAASRVTLLPPLTPTPFVLSLASSTGMLTGHFTHPVSHKSINFFGSAYQKTNSAEGYFMYTAPPVPNVPTTAVSGRVTVLKHP